MLAVSRDKQKSLVHRAACNISVTSCISYLPDTYLSLVFVASFLVQSLVAELAVPSSGGYVTFRRATNLVKSSGHFESNKNNNNKKHNSNNDNPLDRPQ